MSAKQVIDTASDLGIIVQSIGYVRDFVKWFSQFIEDESASMQMQLDAYRLAIKKMPQLFLPY